MMNNINVLVFGILLCFIAAFTNGAKEMSCPEVMAEISKRQMSGVKACNNELNLKGKDKKDKINCVMKCVLKREKLLNAAGLLTDETIGKMLEEEVPPSLVEKVKPMINDCKEKVGPILDDSDPYCKTYAQLIKCLMGMTSICKS